jgi:hypothetical protein
MIPRDTRIQSVGKVCANLLHRATQDKLWRIFMSWLKKIFGRSHKKSIGAKKSEQINLRQSQEKKVLPQKSTEPSSICLEVIADKLQVWVYQHQMDLSTGSIPCLSYVTNGLWAHGNKELILTIRHNESENLLPVNPFVHSPIIDLFKGIYQFVESGQINEGECSSFSTDFWDNWKALAYVSPQPLQLQNIQLETQAPLMAGIFLTAEEFEVYRDFGLTRILSMLGKTYAYYPYPIWFERSRSSVLSVSMMQDSILTKAPKIALVGARVCREALPSSVTYHPNPQPYLHQFAISWDEAGTQIKLKLLSSSINILRDRLSELPPDNVLTLLTDFDPKANGCLVWNLEKRRGSAIVPDESNGSQMGGCFISFVPNQSEDKGLVVEDGFAMLLTDASWLAIRKAIEIGSSVFIPATNGGSSFSLEWLPQVYINPVDGKHHITDGSWHTYLPSSPLEKIDDEAIKIKEVILLTSQQEFAARVQAEVLGTYFKKVEKSVQGVFISNRRQPKQDFVIEFDITSNNQVSLAYLANRLALLPCGLIRQGH